MDREVSVYKIDFDFDVDGMSRKEIVKKLFDAPYWESVHVPDSRCTCIRNETVILNEGDLIDEIIHVAQSYNDDSDAKFRAIHILGKIGEDYSPPYIIFNN